VNTVLSAGFSRQLQSLNWVRRQPEGEDMVFIELFLDGVRSASSCGTRQRLNGRLWDRQFSIFYTRSFPAKNGYLLQGTPTLFGKIVAIFVFLCKTHARSGDNVCRTKRSVNSEQRSAPACRLRPLMLLFFTSAAMPAPGHQLPSSGRIG
jgi:hypothetical protein